MRIKLFENFDNQLDELVSNIKDCFSDMLDDETLELIKQDECIILCFKFETNYKTTSFDDFFKSKSFELKTINEINQCLERLKKVNTDDFDVDFETNIGDFDYEIYLTIEPGSPNQGEFYKKTKNGIKLDFDKLKKILKLPRTTEIGLSTSGSSYRISFNFTKTEELENYQDKLIEDFMSLKIDGDKINGDVEWSWSTSSGAEMKPYKVFKNYQYSYFGRSGKGEATKNSIEFGLNKDLEFTW